MIPESLKKLPLHDVHVALGAKMAPFAGYHMPVRYTSDLDEHHAVRKAVGLFDVSHMGQFLISGLGALPLIQWVSSNDAALLTPGKAQYSALLREDATMVDDIIVYMFRENEYLLVVNASNVSKDFEYIYSQNRFGAELKNISDDYCLFALQGPKATDVLKKLTTYSVQDIAYYHFAVADVAGIADVWVSATGYTGAGGYELYVPNAYAHKLWQAITEAGQPEGILHCGLGARDTLRLEMGYCLYGNDIDDTTHPLEAGLGWITKLNKEGIAVPKLTAIKTAGVARKLSGLIVKEKAIPRRGYDVLDTEGNIISTLTSGGLSPILGYGVAMAYLPTTWAKPGTMLSISVRDRIFAAEVSAFPFIDKK